MKLNLLLCEPKLCHTQVSLKFIVHSMIVLEPFFKQVVDHTFLYAFSLDFLLVKLFG